MKKKNSKIIRNENGKIFACRRKCIKSFSIILIEISNCRFLRQNQIVSRFHSDLFERKLGVKDTNHEQNRKEWKWKNYQMNITMTVFVAVVEYVCPKWNGTHNNKRAKQ